MYTGWKQSFVLIFLCNIGLSKEQFSISVWQDLWLQPDAFCALAVLTTSFLERCPDTFLKHLLFLGYKNHPQFLHSLVSIYFRKISKNRRKITMWLLRVRSLLKVLILKVPCLFDFDQPRRRRVTLRSLAVLQKKFFFPFWTIFNQNNVFALNFTFV